MRCTKLKPEQIQRMIGVTAASSLINPKLLESGIERFARWNFPVRVDDSIYGSLRYLAGPDEDRAAAVHRLATDPQVGTIWCARGGYGATRILPLLEKLGTAKALARDPKLLIGFSDVTGLHLYFHKKLGIPTVHAPMPATMRWEKLPRKTEGLLKSMLQGEWKLGKQSHTASWRGKVLESAPRGGSEGVILGGNLTLVCNMIGTPWQPDLRGKILFLEDCGENPYRVDRMLMHLENAGMLKDLAGVLLGDFEADVVYKEKFERKYWKAVFGERFLGRGYPVISNLPVGHSAKNEPLPLGVRAAITKEGKLLLLEQPVQK